MDIIRSPGVRLGVDPLAGAALGFWSPIIERHGIAATVVSNGLDPTFRFKTADWDGQIRMDCSFPYAMTRLVAVGGKFDIGFANVDTPATADERVQLKALMPAGTGVAELAGEAVQATITAAPGVRIRARGGNWMSAAGGLGLEVGVAGRKGQPHPQIRFEVAIGSDGYGGVARLHPNR